MSGSQSTKNQTFPPYDMSDSNSFAFFGSFPANQDNFQQLNLHHKMMSDSRFSHMHHHNFLPAEILDPTNYINISNWVASQNQHTTNHPNSSQYYAQINTSPAIADDDQISTSRVQIFNQLHLPLKYTCDDHIQEPKVAGESLDCLLSSTNYTNTDNSIEDDGISSLFSDGRNLWAAAFDHSAHQVNAISSGESASHCNGSQSSQNARTQLCLPQVGMRDIYHASENSRSGKMVMRECVVSRNFGLNSSGGLKTVTSCIKDSGMSHMDIPDIPDLIVNATKKRNFDETLLKHDQSYHFLDHTNYLKSDSSENPQKPKKPKSEKCPIINFQQPNNTSTSSIESEEDLEAIAQMKDIIYGAAAFRPVDLGVAEVMEKPKRKNVRISNDPQTVAARQRRERISERIRVLQKLVPGGSKMDTASMLDEAANYLKFLRSKVKELEGLGQWCDFGGTNSCYAANFAYPSMPFLNPLSMQSYFSLHNPNYSFN